MKDCLRVQGELPKSSLQWPQWGKNWSYRDGWPRGPHRHTGEKSREEAWRSVGLACQPRRTGSTFFLQESAAHSGKDTAFSSQNTRVWFLIFSHFSREASVNSFQLFSFSLSIRWPRLFLSQSLLRRLSEAMYVTSSFGSSTEGAQKCDTQWWWALLGPRFRFLDISLQQRNQSEEMADCRTGARKV